eukprot:CAMPEP_0203765480 /NCGR_PEP_ID=MMETSP0098-20131031/18437_1 /ASSEMBLY_ACC=CAM_ASM_000208 /TAXON_ID=96639 /ORGANISM=" , Strain NY0313808BC1" /LENGTH=485 /DNA_ID=CAMNT_0050661737 /DNA_START=37 /DNA_END=1491 /DNA_ORIENTATION=-
MDSSGEEDSDLGVETLTGPDEFHDALDGANVEEGEAFRDEDRDTLGPIQAAVAPPEVDSDEKQQEKRQATEAKWMQYDKNVIVFSRAGKPVYSSNGDELELSSVFSVLQAMMAKTDNRLHMIRAGEEFIMVFAACGPLFLVIISRTSEPVGYLQLQLQFIYAQILFHFTYSALDEAFRRNPGYDLRSMLGGTRTELEGIMELARDTPSLMLQAVPVLFLPHDRNAATSILYSAKQSNLLYAVLFADCKLVTHVSAKRHPLQASDLLLMINFVNKAKQLRSQETWTPLCLPGFNSTGFLHAYASFVSKSICLLLLSSGESLDQFHFCSEAKAKICLQLQTSGLTDKIESMSYPAFKPASCEAASSIHLIYRSLKSGQYFETDIQDHAPLHQGQDARKRLMSRYINISERLHASNRQSIDLIAPLEPAEPNKKGEAESTGQIWDVRDCESVLALFNPSQFEIYATFHIFTTPNQAMACVLRFAAWVR